MKMSQLLEVVEKAYFEAPFLYNEINNISAYKQYYAKDFLSYYFLPHNLSLDTYKFLLDNGLQVAQLLSNVINWPISFDEQKVSLDLAFENGAKIYMFSGNLSDEYYEYFLESCHISPSELLQAIQEPRLSFLNLLVKYGVDFNEIQSLPRTCNLETYQLFLDNGLSANKALSLAANVDVYKYNNNSRTYQTNHTLTLQQEQFIKLAFERQADVNSIEYLPLVSASLLQLLLERGLNPDKATALILNSSVDRYNYQTSRNEPEETLVELQEQLLQILIDHKANLTNIHYISSLHSLTTCQTLLENKLDPNVALKAVLNDQVYDYAQNGKFIDQFVQQQKELLKLILEYNPDVNIVLKKLIYAYHSTYVDGHRLIDYIPPEICEVLLEHNLQPQILLNYAIHHLAEELVKLVLTRYPDILNNNQDRETFINDALSKGSFSIVKLLITNNANPDMSIDNYMNMLAEFNLHFATRILELLDIDYQEQQIYEFARAHGASHLTTSLFIDFHNLLHDYIQCNAGNSCALNSLEMQLLNPDISSFNLAELQATNLPNKYGYSALHLAILANKYELAQRMVESGMDIYSQTKNGITSLHLISSLTNSLDASYERKNAFLKSVSDMTKDVDIVLDNGESLADILITNPELSKKVIAQTNDTLFYFVKNNADLFALSKNPSKTYIAISHGDGFWSTGIWAAARLMQAKHQNVEFYLVTEGMVKKGGREFLEQFNAVINPGAADSYPKHLEEFGKNDLSFEHNLEKHYQNMLDQTYQLDIPYLGMCAGAQHFSLYHEGSLQPVKGYDSGRHQVAFFEGTLPYFLTLTQDQQYKLLTQCELPSVSFKGDTAHHFAAIHNKLGNQMQLGALSEDGIAMAYAHENGIRYATQFHPEHYYNSFSEESVHQKAWLDNFIAIANLHHDHIQSGIAHPTSYFNEIKDRMNECINAPTCLVDELSINVVSNSTYWAHELY